MKKKYKTLAIETSCDDTSVAIVASDGKTFWVENMLAYSQVKDHQPYGGVVPEIASRLHSEKILTVLDSIGQNHIEAVDTISVTTEPGLPGSLLVGKSVSATLASYHQKPLIEVNHIHGHVFSLLLDRNIGDFSLPMVVLSISGGHNDLYLVEKKKTDTTHVGPFSLTKLGQTRDDAVGEAFDKASRMLGGPYPGGPRIGQQAVQHKGESAMLFSRSFLEKGSFDFSFSGVKSQVWREVENIKLTGKSKESELENKDIQRLAFEFQEAVVEVLAKKLVRAATCFGAKTLGIVGGVSANKRLRSYTQDFIDKKLGHEANLILPSKFAYCTDNAAMIGVVGLLDNMNITH